MFILKKEKKGVKGFMNKTDLRVVKTLAQIDRALMKCLEQTSLQKLTVDQLCQEALINRSTFYKYYQDKYDLVDQYLARTLQEFRRQTDVAFVEASAQNIHSLIYQKNFEKALQYLYKNKARYTLLWSGAVNRPVFTEMVKVIHDNILDKLCACGLHGAQERYVDLYAQLFASDMMTLVRWWFQYEDEISMEEVQQIMANNMKQGLFGAFRQTVDGLGRSPQ